MSAGVPSCGPRRRSATFAGLVEGREVPYAAAHDPQRPVRSAVKELRLSRTRFEHCSVAEAQNCNPPVRGKFDADAPPVTTATAPSSL